MNRRAPFPLAPTANMGGLLFILAAMWYAGASQGNGAAYFLFFLLLAVLLVSAPRTFLNIARLDVRPEPVRPAFAGQEFSLPVEILNPSRRVRIAIRARLLMEGSNAEIVDEIGAGNSARTTLRFRATLRGEHEINGVELGTVYPLGFLKSVRVAPVRQCYIVYPKPGGDPKFPISPVSAGGRAEIRLSGGDDFSGVRTYIAGESQRHVDWKAVARSQPMMTKQFTSETDGTLWFDYAVIPQKSVEARLSQLTLWVVEAERARLHYGLRLPGQTFPPSVGEAHYHKCLRALALHR